MSEPNLEPLKLLRRRWELASVLNFFDVFEPLMKAELGLSAEEIEEALISPNNDLARLHIALLKGIPPAARNMKEPNAWITATSKKLDPWWKWVAEGENPLRPDHGKEITTYAELNPVTRLLILKAVCELRGEQEDVLRYIADELKMGRPIINFRKESIGNNRGFTYWYDGTSDLGYRLYREEVKVEHKPNWNRKGRLTESKMEFQWETIATNLDEFQEIAEKMISSEDIQEASIGERIKVDILPKVEALYKKRERKLKRQQKEALMLDVFRNSLRISRTRRGLQPVSYTYDDYDQRINEAINQAENIRNDDRKDNSQEGSRNGALQSDSATSSKADSHSDFGLTNSDSDCGKGRIAKRKRGQNPNLPVVLRRSKRNAPTSDQMGYRGNGTPEAKKRLRQRPVVNTEYISDSEADMCNYQEAARVSDSESD
ncbi:DDT domain-containing protein DDR4 isoform X1 [Carex rostrata]